MPVVMISGHGTIETAVAAIQRGAYDFIEKPFKSDRLLLVVRRALEAAELARGKRRTAPARRARDTLTGESPAIASAAARRRARCPDRLARADHRRAGFRQGDGGADDPRQLPPRRWTVRRAELRHARAGALRGGTVRRRGRADPNTHPRRVGVLERAHGGTLLLDEVSDMPLETQGKIVRVLQDRGSSGSAASARVKVDVRVLSTTNKDLNRRSAPAGSARTCITGWRWCR